MIAFDDQFQIASLLKIPFLDEDIVNDSYPRKVLEAIGLDKLSFKYSYRLVVRECVFPVVIFFWSAFLYPFLRGT